MQFGIFSGHPAGGFNLVMTGGFNERVAASGGKQAINITPALLITSQALLASKAHHRLF